MKQQGRPSEAGRELVELHYGRPVVYNSVPNSDVLPTCSELQEDAEDGGLIKFIPWICIESI